MSRSLLTRRQLLGGGLLAATVSTAGCLSLFNGGETGDGDTRRLEVSMHRHEGRLRDSEVTSGDDPPGRWADGALAAAIDGEKFTTQYRKPFFSRPNDPVYVRHEDTYYELDSVIVDEVTETHPILRLQAVDDGNETSEGVATETLPEGDRRAVEIAHMAARARGNEGGMPVGLVERDGYVYRDDQAIADSRLLGDESPAHVTFRDTLYSVTVTEGTFHEPVYRATATAVAETPDRMESILQARFVDARLSSDELSRDAREVIREARTPEAYSERHPYSDAFAELLTAMHKRPFLDGNIQKDARRSDLGTGMISVDREYCEYRLRFLGDS